MSDPTRQPCAGTIRTTANCANVVEGGDVIYKNVSTMKDEVGADVAPFERWGQYSDACATEYIDCRQLGESAGEDKFHCFSVLTDELVLEALPPDTELGDDPTVKNGNTFEQTQAKTPSACNNFGVKIVDAIKNWHGAFPFTHDENGIDCEFPWKKWNSEDNKYDLHKTDIGGCVPNRSNVKYLTRNFQVLNYSNRLYARVVNQINVDGTNYGEPPGTYTGLEVNFAANVTRTVDEDTGLLTSSGAEASMGITENTVTENSTNGGFYPRYFEHEAGTGEQTTVCGDISNDGLGNNYGFSVKDDIRSSPRCLADLPLFDAAVLSNIPIGWPTQLGAFIASSGMYNCLEQPEEGDTVTVGSQSYTFTSSASEADEIQIGETVSETLGNFSNAMHSHPQVSPNIIGNYGPSYLARRSGVTDEIALSSSAPTRFKFYSSALAPAKTFTGWSWDDDVVLLLGQAYDTAHATVTITRTATGYSWSVHLEIEHDINYGTEWEGSAFSVTELNYSGIITLSDPYTINDVLADAKVLADEWRLSDKKANLDHRWRGDEHVYEAVEVRQDERSDYSPEVNFDICQVDDYANPLPYGEHEPFTAQWVPTWGKRPWFDEDFKWNNPVPTNSNEAAAMAVVPTGKYTGKIIGSPLPLGYGVSVDGSPRGSFDHFFERWQEKYCQASYSCWSSDIYRGMWTPAYIPENAQRWTRQSYFVSTPSHIYPCSFVRAGTDSVHLRKMVQTIVPRPAYDFTRPHTADRYLLAQPASPTAVDKIYYVSSVAGSVVTLINRDGTEPSSVSSDFTVFDLVLIPEKNYDGVPLEITPGVYTVEAVSGSTVTVDMITWKLPTGFTNDSRDADQAFGKIRFKDAPGFSGRLKVSVAYGTEFDPNASYSIGDSVRYNDVRYVSLKNDNQGFDPEVDTDYWMPGMCLTYAESPYIQTGDKVDLFVSTLYENNGGTGFELQRLDDTHALLNETDYDDVSHIVPHAYAVTDPETSAPLSGQKWWFCGVEQTYKDKGDYVVRNWTLNTDSGQQEPNTSQTFQRCLPLGIPCSPKVAGHSPNETNSDFINGKIEAFPATINNGNAWLGAVEQHMVDPLWQTPHKPGGPDWDNILWSRDDGSCRQDGPVYVNYVLKEQRYYRLPDFYEARISVPGGHGPANNKTAPGLPAGIEPLDTAQPPLSSGILSQPCTQGSSFYYDEAMPTMETPWGIYYRQLGCVCSFPAGRFHEQYQANGIGC